MTREELNAIITKELRPFGIEKAELGREFQYEYETDVITFCIVPDYTDRYFTDFLDDRFDYEDKYPFAMSLLHELGHKENNDDIEGDVYAFCIGEKYKIANDINDCDDEDRMKLLYYRYFSLPDEIMATSWAINYAKKHIKQVKRWEQMFSQAIEEYSSDHTNALI